MQFENIESVSPEVADVLVSLDIEVSDDVVFFGGGVHDVVLVLREVDQVDPVLLWVQGPLVHPSLAIVNYNLKHLEDTQLTFYVCNRLHAILVHDK